MAILTSPEYPVSGSSMTLSMTATIGTVAGFEIVKKPNLSQNELGLILDDLPPAVERPTSPLIAAGIEVKPGDNLLSDTFTPDRPGEYLIKGYDLKKIVGFPAFPGDPAGDERFELVGVQEASIKVGQYVDLKIVTGDGDGGTIRIKVTDQIVREVLIVDTTTELARVAALQNNVTAAMAAMLNFDIKTVGTDLQEGVNDLRAKYDAHRQNDDAHKDLTGANSEDVTHVVFKTDANSQDGAILLVNELREAIVRHMLLSSSFDALDMWHCFAAAPQDDLKNLPLIAPAENIAGATALSVELRHRTFNRHAQQVAGDTAPHPVEGTFAVPACHREKSDLCNDPSLLDSVIVAYLDAIEKTDPNVIEGESEGIIDAAHLYGFKLVDT